jgi:hypothetical protein
VTRYIGCSQDYFKCNTMHTHRALLFTYGTNVTTENLETCAILYFTFKYINCVCHFIHQRELHNRYISLNVIPTLSWLLNIATLHIINAEKNSRKETSYLVNCAQYVHISAFTTWKGKVNFLKHFLHQ